ncbi:hypothetical protein, partial [Escherichia coli]|uniref:hypothetical protein n=1 Tax=Escherichia coli TaxID=562 RepID=UPI001C4EC544
KAGIGACHFLNENKFSIITVVIGLSGGICNVPAAVVCVTNLHLSLQESSGLVYKTGKDI